MEVFTGMLVGFMLGIVFCAFGCKNIATINGEEGGYFCTFRNRLYRLQPESTPDAT